MKKRTSVFARIVAFLALVAAIAAVYVVVTGSLDESSSKPEGNKQANHQTKPQKQKPKVKAATYEVQPGDTLSRISHLSGVPVTELKELNPEVDPLGLIAGEELKLR